MSYNSVMKTYHYIIKGSVQGVAFRYYTIKYAQKLSIRGSVTNLFNGDVEVFAQGAPEDIKRFEAFLQTGPPAAMVEHVSKEESEIDENYQGFQIGY
jgi:acylphosphatase